MADLKPRSLDELAWVPVQTGVLQAYGQGKLVFGPEYLIPMPFDPRLIKGVPKAEPSAAVAAVGAVA